MSGYWQGFISGAFATLGLLLGGLLGIWLAPEVLGDAAPALWVSLAALFVVLICASFGQAVLQYAGARIRDWIKWQPCARARRRGRRGAEHGRGARGLVGARCGRERREPAVGQQVRSSDVLQLVDDVMPAQAVDALDSFNDVVGSSFFPQYLEPFAKEQIVDVGLPPGRIGRDSQVRAAAASVLKVRGENACNRGVEGTGFLYSRPG